MQRELSQIFEENKTLANKISHLHRRSEKSIQRIKSAEQFRELLQTGNIVREQVKKFRQIMQRKDIERA